MEDECQGFHYASSYYCYTLKIDCKLILDSYNNWDVYIRSELFSRNQMKMIFRLFQKNVHFIYSVVKATLQSPMSIHLFVCQQNIAINHHPSSFSIHNSSFFIHPSSFTIHPSSSLLHFATFKLFSLFVFHQMYFIF